jgi:integrase
MKQDGPAHVLIFDGVCADYVTQKFREAVKDTGIVDFTFHDLRHYFRIVDGDERSQSPNCCRPARAPGHSHGDALRSLVRVAPCQRYEPTRQRLRLARLSPWRHRNVTTHHRTHRKFFNLKYR